jgi:hypothetical protein
VDVSVLAVEGREDVGPSGGDLRGKVALGAAGALPEFTHIVEKTAKSDFVD